jgi:hypothetical protein
MNKAAISSLAVLLAGAVTATSASATTGSEGFFYNNVEVATLDWTTVGGSTSFALDLLTAPNANAFGFSIEFNGPNGAFADTDNTTHSTGIYGSHVDAGYTYTWDVKFPTANNTNRLTLGETATWTIASAGPFVPDMPLLHLNSFTTNGQSVKLCGVSLVPEPASGALLLAGLAGLGLLARRRQPR